MYAGFLGGNLKERDNLLNQDVDGRFILKRVLNKYDGNAYT